jgi:tetratricopeptide (TPR) repeat protein
MIKKRKWLKITGIFFGSIFSILLVLGIIFNQVFFQLVLGLGYMDIYNGNNERGNAIMQYGISHMDTITAETYHSLSVQNTKNGNYDIAIKALEESYKLDPDEAGAYLGWVLLYYYHDDERALNILEKYDVLTPDFSDAPMGEDIHYLKGLAHMQLEHYNEAIREFDTYINEVSKTHGEAFVDVYVFVQKGRCLAKTDQLDAAVYSYERAVSNYDECTEAYYYCGITLMELNQKDSACIYLNKASSLIQNGYKSSDTYVEYFHEIYPQQIQLAIEENCNDLPY